MNPPNLPTDSLYKFQALSGVALLFLVVVLIFQDVNTWRARRDSLAMSIAEIEAKVETARVNHYVALSKATKNQLAWGDLEKLAQVNDSIYVRAKLNMELRKQHAAAGEELVQHLKVLWSGLFFALLVAADGFRRWQGKLQRNQDTLLELQVREARARLAEFEAKSETGGHSELSSSPSPPPPA